MLNPQETRYKRDKVETHQGTEDLQMSINGGSMYKKAKNKIFRKERRQKHRKNLQSSGISITNTGFAAERLKIFYQIFRNFKKHDSKNSQRQKNEDQSVKSDKEDQRKKDQRRKSQRRKNQRRKDHRQRNQIKGIRQRNSHNESIKELKTRNPHKKEIKRRKSTSLINQRKVTYKESRIRRKSE